MVTALFEAAAREQRAGSLRSPSKRFEPDHVKLEEVERVCGAIQEQLAEERALLEALAIAEAGSADNAETDLGKRGSDDG